MSFIYAKKAGKSIAVFADTKITFDQPDAKQYFGNSSRKAIGQFGMIKNIIISSNYCVSYAGNNIIHANSLLSKIERLSLQELLKAAVEENQADPENGTEFIVCYANKDTRDIYLIKDGRCNNVDVAWIGSWSAFNYFQGVRNGAYSSSITTNIPHGVEISFGETLKTLEDTEYQDLFDAFNKTIFDCGDNTVGGFSIPVLFDTKTNCFRYKGYIKSYTMMQATSTGFSLPMYQGSQSGTFSVIFYDSSTIVGIYIPEASLGILYNDYREDGSDYNNKYTASFPIPFKCKLGQLDFYVQCDSHGMKAPGFLGCDPNKIDDYLERVWFYKDNPNLAILYINKAIQIITKQHREVWRLDALVAIRENILAGL